jgi:hypothetical protein
VLVERGEKTTIPQEALKHFEKYNGGLRNKKWRPAMNNWINDRSAAACDRDCCYILHPRKLELD